MDTMNASDLKELAAQFVADTIDINQFLDHVAASQSLRLAASTIDLDRQRRCGFPEVIYGEGKTVEALCAILDAQMERGIAPLATRISPEQATAVIERIPNVQYNAMARTLRVLSEPDRQDLGPHAERIPASWGDFVEDRPLSCGSVAVITAGTSDLPVAEEACETLQWLGIEPIRIHDVGVAGPHRLVERLVELRQAEAIVVVAGMEGALPSIVGGHVACPVIGVPTSVGYGASFGGVSALLGMLNSCASNVVVVNINAGFKAAYVAAMIAQQKS